MINQRVLAELRARIDTLPRTSLALLPTPIQPLNNFSQQLAGPVGGLRLSMKRDDLSGLEGGGNKTRKLEFLIGDALKQGANILATVGAIQSNHTRQTAAAAAKVGLKCALLHCAWTKETGPDYRKVGNILLSHLMGADLYVDNKERPIEDQSQLGKFVEHLEKKGHKPYLIPGGASEHPLGCMGYINCAAELATQSLQSGQDFDYLLHCTGSGSTQAGLLAGFAVLRIKTQVIGISDDEEVEIKKVRVRQLANDALRDLGYDIQIDKREVEIVSVNANAYGIANQDLINAIRLFAKTEGLIADPVYEGRAIQGLLHLARAGRFKPNSSILLMHLGGSPAIHAYAEQFGAPEFQPFTG